jgi:ketosteroid isomerase-like protein
MSESRNESRAATADRHRALVDRYFACVASGDPAVAELFADDVVWRTPASSPMQGPYEGRAAVLELMGSGVGLYDADTPLDIQRIATAANGEQVFVEMRMRARTGSGEPYDNTYVFVFTIRDDRIVEVHEHLDTLYAQRRLFDPVGQSSPLG